ncbi:hypothetical protein N9O57_00210 [bacterium]|nr:hypothetical protein [bacterium]
MNFKTLLLMTLFVFSSNLFACVITNRMGNSNFFMKGISNKLSSMAEYENYNVIELKRVDWPYAQFEVLITKDFSLDDSSQCLKLLMSPKAETSCEYFADIESIEKVFCLD